MRFFKQLSNTAKRVRASDFLQGKDDLPSVGKFVAFHIEELMLGNDVKGITTDDQQTISAARKVFKHNYSDTDLRFFERVVMQQQNQSSNETGSIKVIVSDIRDFSKYLRDYEAEKEKGVMICVGGPAAEDQVVMASLMDKIRSRLDDVLYLTRDYKESNVNNSAKQSHARHSNALNADENFTGHALLPTLLMRKILGTTTEDTMDADYRKIDVKFTLDPKKLRIYFGNEINWLKQEYRMRNGQLTEHDINRIEAVLSQEIMKVVEDQSGLSISSGVRDSLLSPSSIHVTFGEKNNEEIVHENELFRRAGMNPQRLTREEINYFFKSDEISQAWKYPGDTQIKFNDHQINREYAESHGAKWLEEVEVERILLAKGDNGRARVAGVMTKDGKYFYADKLHFTGGYKVDYTFDRESTTRFLSHSPLRNLANRIEDYFDIQQPLPSEITTSTGVSINAVFRKSDRISRIIEKYGTIGQIAVTNSHWTMIAHDNEHLVVRITGGGNTGSEEYSPAYFLNVIANTRRIFGDDLVGILSTYGCPRAVNARNSTEFAKIADGGVISYGKGGTGNTKRHAEAAIGLMMIGFEEEVVEYFNQFQGRNNNPLGDEISEIYKHVRDVNFLHDEVDKTNRRMGYDKSLSYEESAMALAVLAAASYALYKELSKNRRKEAGEERVEEIDDNPSTTTILQDTLHKRLVDKPQVASSERK